MNGSNDTTDSASSSWKDTFVTIFAWLNLVFLVGTAFWFRLDHASGASKRYERRRPSEALLAELQWQYSLRSNLLLWGCSLASYLVWVGEVQALMWILAMFSVVNVVTDLTYTYHAAGRDFSIVQKGHRVAAVVIWMVVVFTRW